MRSLLNLLSLAAATSAALLVPRNDSHACNNSPDLCSHSYADIVHLGAHDSPFVQNNANSGNQFTFIQASNQNINSTAQLTAGVRLLSAQVHKNNGAWHLCHTSCGLLDAGPLGTWLAEIKIWMDANPYDVVTLLLVNSDNASPSDLDAEFKSAGINSYSYTPPSTTSAPPSWPTLQDMIANHTRLVTFVASLPPASNTMAPYLLDEFTFLFENDYNVTSPSNFSCTADRPAPLTGQTAQALSSNRLPLVNHFLDKADNTFGGSGVFTPDTGNITTTNGKIGVGSLGAAATDCTDTYKRNPFAFLVDFFDQGQTLAVVDGLNGITPVGRGSAPASKSTGATSNASSVRATMGVSVTQVASVGGLILCGGRWVPYVFGAWMTYEIGHAVF